MRYLFHCALRSGWWLLLAVLLLCSASHGQIIGLQPTPIGMYTWNSTTGEWEKVTGSSTSNPLPITPQAFAFYAYNTSLGRWTPCTSLAACFGGGSGTGITALTGDVLASGSGSVAATVVKVNGVSYSSSPSLNTVPVVTGSSTVSYEQVPNAALANSAITLDGTSVALGSTYTTPVFTTTTNGFVPAPGSSGTTLYLRQDGTWATPSGSGSITAAGQFAVPYYSAAGTASTVSGNSSFTYDGLGNVALTGNLSNGSGRPPLFPADPNVALQGATKQYVDNQVATRPSSVSLAMPSGYNVANPTSPSGAINVTWQNASNLGLGYNTTGVYNNSFNTAVGTNALAANSSLGGSNTAVGYNALTASTSAGGNTAVGANALASTTTSGGNTAVGYAVLQANTGGTGNTATGSNSLQVNTTGTGNVAMGTSALGNNTTGSDNTSIGFQSGWTGSGNVSGSQNVYIGAGAGPQTSGLSNAIAIGYNAQNTASNQTVIGNSSTTDTEIFGAIGNGSGAPPLLASGAPPSGHQAMSPADLSSQTLAGNFISVNGKQIVPLSGVSDLGSTLNSILTGISYSGSVYIPDGTYTQTTPISITPSLNGGLDIECASHKTIINYTGNTNAFVVNGAGVGGPIFQGINVHNCYWTLSGAAPNTDGIHLLQANGVNFWNVRVDGATRDGFRSEGSQTINCYSCHIQSSSAVGVHNLGNSSICSNAIKFFGGAIGNSGSYNWYEDPTSCSGRNQNNGMIGGIIEAQSGNTPNGSIFVEDCDSCSFYGNYIENYNSISQAAQIINGNVAGSGLGTNTNHSPNNTVIRDNFINANGATSVISLLGGTHTIDGNNQASFNTNWILINPNVTGGVIGWNNAGYDRINSSGSPSTTDTTDNYALNTTFVNNHSATRFGQYFNYIVLGSPTTAGSAVVQCLTAGVLPVGALTTNTSSCGTFSDTHLRVH